MGTNAGNLTDRFAQALDALGDRHLAVVTGAGISLASGIPTFRGTDPDAVWKHDVTELGTRRYFEQDPVGSWRWYLGRFDVVFGKAPNEAHHALRTIEKWHTGRGGEFTLVTQNIDGLHEAAQSENLIKVHGSADRVRCSRNGCEFGAPSGSLERARFDITSFVDTPSVETLPRCPACNTLLRQHVLWFDEYYDEHDSYRWRDVTRAALDADLVLFVGTSFAVGVTDLYLRYALDISVPCFAIDPGEASAPHRDVTMIREPGEDYLPSLCAALRMA